MHGHLSTENIFVMNKILEKVGTDGTYLKVIKSGYEKPRANIILDEEKWRSFPLKLGTSQGCPLASFLFNIMILLKVLARASRQKEDIKIEKGEVKLFLFSDDMILPLKDPMESTEKFLHK